MRKLVPRGKHVYFQVQTNPKIEKTMIFLLFGISNFFLVKVLHEIDEFLVIQILTCFCLNFYGIILRPYLWCELVPMGKQTHF
ncbi:hypothetical protein H5410_035130 [Solanum commersonii]|uniref:Uncharacterized protein n=1 Tax=Solanum commersonii TaxID=4109 RepID=A0A9J5Y1R5_SOLCO|nr:hypothetical protein H5410_035130 [Solanum commersonii]